MNISNTKLKMGAREDYTDEQWAQIRVAKDALYDAERSVQIQNDCWRLMLESDYRDARFRPMTGPFKTYEEVKRMKWQRREARIALRRARAAYVRAVNDPPALKALGAAMGGFLKERLLAPSLMEQIFPLVPDGRTESGSLMSPVKERK